MSYNYCYVFQTGTILENVKLYTSQPCLVAVGQRKNLINSYFIAFEEYFIPAVANNAIDALDELFKSHFVFNTSYDNNLKNFYHFVEYVFYGLNQNNGLTPTMQEIRRKLAIEN